MRRFLIAEREVLCSKMMPCGKDSDGLNDTHSLRLIPALSAGGGVRKMELPVLKDSKSYTLTQFAVGSSVKTHKHDEAQLRIITKGTFDIVVRAQKFKELKEGDWLYIPKDTPYRIQCGEEGAIVTGYGMSCKCSGTGLPDMPDIG